MSKFRIINGTWLKLFAALCMLIDHVGLMFFPNVITFRVIGRLAFPIFAFMISEGARYTRSKLRYFLSIFSVAVLCSLVYYFFSSGSLYLCILVTFSISVLLIYALSWFKRCLFSKDSSLALKLLSLLIFLAGVAFAAILDYHPFFDETLGLRYDGGFGGCMVPVAASLFDLRGTDAPESLRKLDNITVRVMAFGVSLLGMLHLNHIQWVSLFTIIPLLMYSERRGKYSLKYFFYIFYPLHLVALQGIYMLIKLIN